MLVPALGLRGYHLWNDTHFMSSISMHPELVRSSAKCSTSMPCSSCMLKSIPDFDSSSMESWAYISVLDDSVSVRSASRCSCTHPRVNLKLNCQVEIPGGDSPVEFEKDKPSCIILSKSTLHRRV